MSKGLTRRCFVGGISAGSYAPGAFDAARSGPNEKITVGMIAVGGRHATARAYFTNDSAENDRIARRDFDQRRQKA